jgi:hypothetical protein
MAITTVNSYLTASGLNFREGTTGKASLLLDPSSDKINLSGDFNLNAGSLTIGGNAIVTGTSAIDSDTLATVTARGATTSSNLTLNGDITVASSKYIGIGSTLAAIQFGDGSVGNETADLSFVTNSDGEITFNRGGNKLVIGSTTSVTDGDFLVDTDTLYVDASENNVGIGTASPAYHLDVTGIVNAYRYIQDGNVGSDFYAVTASRSSSSLTSPDIYDKNSHGLVLGGTHNEASLVVKVGGNVGIGETNPEVKLEVAGDILAKDSYVSAGFGASDGYQYHDLGTGYGFKGIASPTRLGVLVQGIESMTWESNGRVGIGSTNPASHALEVNGTISGDKILGKSGVYTYGKFGSVEAFGDAIYVGEVRTNSLSDKASNGNAQINFGGASKTIEFETDATARMFIAANGNVGIGIGSSAANQKFTVGARSNFDSQNNYYGAWIDGNTAGDSWVAVGQWYNVGGRMEAASNNLYIHTHNEGHDLVLQSGGANVGIGTHSPNKQVQIGSTDSNDVPWLRLQEDSSGGDKRLDLYVTGAVGTIASEQSSSELAFRTTDGEAMRINPNGKVGIGTTFPSHKLDIYSDENVPLRIHRPNSSLTTGEPVGIAFSHRGDNNSSTTDTRAGIFSSYNGDLFFSVDQGGRVDDHPIEDCALFIEGSNKYIGIGVTDPDNPVEISGSDNGLKISSLSTDRPRLTFDCGGSEKFILSTNSTYGAIGDSTDINRYMVFNGGNVGIGVSDPDQKLEVNGNIRIPNEGKIVFGSAGSTPNDYLELYDVGTGDTLLRLVQDGVKRFSVQGVNGHVYMQNKLQIDAGSTNTNTGEISFNTQYNTAFIRSSYTDPSASTETYLAFHANTDGAANGTVAEQMRIAGNHVGIGTTNPLHPLDVSGAVHIEWGNTLTEDLVTIKGGGSAGDYDLLKVEAANGDDLFTVGGYTYDVLMPDSDTNVGIGTTTASAKVHLNGPSAGFSEILRLQRDGGNYYSIGLDNGDLNFCYNGQSADGSTLVIDGAADSVGIGTKSPSTELDVAGTGSFKRINIYNSTYNANPRLCVGRNDNEAFKFYVDDMFTKITAHQDLDGDGDHRFIIDREFAGTGNSSFHIANSGNYHLTIDKNGDVGIGESTPDAKLHLRGTTNNNLLRIENSTSSLSQNDTIGAIQFYNNDTTDESPNVAASIYAVAGPSGGGGQLEFRTVNAGEGADATTSMTIKKGGNVGINVTDPDEKLEIAGKTHLGGRGQDGGAYIAYATLSETNGGAATILGNAVYAGTASNVYRKTYNDAGNFIRMTYNKGICFHTNVTGNAGSTEYSVEQHEQMRLTTGGYVGIGSADPQYKLDVNNGTFRCNGIWTTSSTITHWGNNGTAYGTLTWDSPYAAVLANSSKELRLGANGSTGELTIQTDGIIQMDADVNVEGWISSHSTGTSRIYTTEVKGDASANSLVMETDGAGNRTRLWNYGTSTHLLIEGKGNNSDIHLNSREAIRFYTSGSASSYSYGSQRMTITADGKVGIGTSSPDYTLTVDAGATNEIARFRTTDNDALISISDNTDTVYIGHDASADVMSIGFSNTVGSTSNVNIDTAGSVGIGTSDPASKLHVEGTIQTQVYAIGSLPSASPAGQRAMVNNSYYTFGSSVVGSTVYAGGSAVAPVYSDGSYWRYG